MDQNRIVEPITLGLGIDRFVAAYQDSGALADCTIGGLPFQFAIDDGHPYVRETIDYRRQQIDTSPEPGEQSLSQWWVRDQDTWHRGAGAVWYEPGNDASTVYRYSRSVGVNVWEQGQLTLLPAMTSLISASTGSSAHVEAAVIGGIGVVFAVVDGVLVRHDGIGGVNYSSSFPGGGRPAIAGSTVLLGSTGAILSGTVSGSNLTQLWTTVDAAFVQPWWIKSRIIAAKQNKIYDLPLTAGNLDTQTPLWTHPSSDWSWTAVAEAPGSILAAGRSSGSSSLYSFSLVATPGSTTPSLGPAIQVATLPPGEEIYSLAVYLGGYLVLGTSRGVRIGTVDRDGTVSYGPLTVQTTKPVLSLAARDRWVYATVNDDIDGSSGCVRIDLSEEIPGPQGQTGTLRYAWSYDVATTGQVSSIAFLGVSDRVVLGTVGAGVKISSTTAHVSSGYLTSGKIRFATNESKQFALLRLRGNFPEDSTVAVSTIDSGGSEISAYSVNSTWSEADLILPGSDRLQAYIAIKLTLRTATTGESPIVDGVSVKATPAPRVQRIIRLPLKLHDFEQDRNRVKYGFTGAAVHRLQVLEQLEQGRRVISFTDNTADESFSVQIRSVQMVRDTPPSRGAFTKNFGGIVTVDIVVL